MALTAAEKAQLEAELVAINKSLLKAYTATEYSTAGNTIKRPDIKLLVKRKGQITRILKGGRIKELF